MNAISCLECRPNSHPFQQRTLYLVEPVKIGRSVARARPTENNAIFDCKVLSRNHALLWYENGKFFLKDTKSSNGTFVNNYRLSKGSEESSPHELFYGDVVQFGVDVMENSKKGTVTHGCIIATLKLYLPGGQEAKPSSPSICFGGGLYDISSRELSQLYFSLQEAQQREKMIESKLSSFQQIVVSIQDAASKSWSAMIEEDRLLQHIELLENQLALYGKNCTEDTSREEVRRILEEKSMYETSAKESLQRLLEEKMQSINKCSDLESSLSLLKTKLNLEKETTECVKNELENALNKLTAQAFELRNLNEKIKTLEDQLKTAQDQQSKESPNSLDSDNGQVTQDNLLTTNSMLKRENELIIDHLNLIESQFKNERQNKLQDLDCLLSRTIEELELKDTEVEKTLSTFRSTLQSVQDRIWQTQEELLQTQSSIARLTSDAESASKAEQECQAKKAELRDELCDKKSKQESNAALIDYLKSQIETLDSRLRDCEPETPKIVDDLSDNSVTLCRYKKNTTKSSEDGEGEDSNIIENSSSDSCPNFQFQNSQPSSPLINDVQVDKNALNGSSNRICGNAFTLREDIDKLKDTLKLAEKSKSSAESELIRITEELSKVSALCLTSTHEATNLQHQLAANEAILTEKKRIIASLLEIDGEFEPAVEVINSHLSVLMQKISEGKRECSSLRADNCELESKLKEAEFLSGDNVKKMEDLRDKLIVLGRDNADGKSDLNADDNSSTELGSQEPSYLNSSHHDNDSLNSTSIIDNEGNSFVTTDSLSPCKEEVLAGQVLSGDLEMTVDSSSATQTISLNGKHDSEDFESEVEESTDIIGSSGSILQELSTQDESTNALKRELEVLRENHRRLKEQLLLSNSEFADLALQNKMAIAMTVIPLFILIVGIFTAFYDTVSGLTGTTEY